MKTRRILSFVLTLTMLLTLFSGEFASAAGMKIVTAGEELAYDPLAETASVAYEQHDAGYAVSLDRAADSVTMHVTAVPGSRSADKARLYVRTGVELKAGTAYRVSFALSSEKKLADYTVNFDGDTAAAYGKLDKRSIDAGATDRVEYTVTPKAANGELVLRLLLGKTEVNTLRFSDLAVEEAPAEQSGANKLLVDKLNYAAPGAIRCAAEAGYSAEMDSTDTSATMTVTNVPKSGAEVWKLKLMVSTGLKPEPGKTYRFRATLNASNSGSYEACYNEGEVEKGYDVLYNQSLKSGSQTVERMIYVPTDKENPGELIVQFSLGKLSKGTKVTISKVTVEEASPAYTSALARDFALDTTREIKTYDTREDVISVDSGNLATTKWGSIAVEKSGAGAGDLTFEGSSTAKLHVIPTDVNGVFSAKMHISAGKLEANKHYLVIFRIESTEAYSFVEDNSPANQEYEILYGSAIHGDFKDNDEEYGYKKVQRLAADTPKTIEQVISVGTSDTDLIVTLQLGNVGSTARDVTVSEFRIVELYKLNAAQNNSDNTLTISENGLSATLTKKVDGGYGNGASEMYLQPDVTLESGKHYRVTFDLSGAAICEAREFAIRYGTGHSDWSATTAYSKGFYKLTRTSDGTTTITRTITPTDAQATLCITLQCGKMYNNANITASNLRIEEVADGKEAEASYQNADSTNGYRGFEVSGGGGTLAYTNNDDHQRAELTCAGGSRTLWIHNITELTAGKTYEVSFRISASNGEWNLYDFTYVAKYNYWNDDRVVGGFGETGTLTSANTTVVRYLHPKVTKNLEIQLDLENAGDGKKITINEVKVREVVDDVDGAAWAETPITAYTATLARTNSDATLAVTHAPDKTSVDNWKDFNARLRVRTGVTPAPSQAYLVQFTLTATKPQNKFHVQYSGNADDSYGGEFNLSLAANTPQIVKHIIPAGASKGELTLRILLGLVDQTNGNTFVVSNVTVEEVTLGAVPDKQTGEWFDGTVTNDVQEGYSVPLTRAKDSATVEIKKTPATGMEAWKHKLFLDTGVKVNEGEAYRVVFDTLAENDMDFEVCYNRGSTEKGFAAIYGLHAAAGKTKTVEKMVFAEGSGKLIVQLSLGNVPAPNKVTVSNLRVERIKYSYSGKSALPAEISYQAGDVSYWAHADYDARFTNTADAVTAHITPPAKSPEPWKVKLFLDTGVALEGGKYYKVTADVSAKKSQNYEICYNNGGVEFGYDSMGGLKVTGGKTERIEKLISVPAGKKDTNNLMLQFNLGKTAIANEVTIGGVTVEEVTLAYANAMGKDFSYQKSLSTWTDPKTTYKATLDSAADAATLHISGVPTSGTGVWMVKLFVHTGAMLEAGKSYQVSADLLAAKAQDFETCFNNEETEKGFDAIYGQKLAAGVKTTVDKRISVPASMTDAGELVLQFSVGGAVANDITLSNVSVQELQYGGSGDASPVPDTVIDLSQSAQAAGALDVTREKLTYRMTKIAADAKDNAIKVAGADLRSGDLYTVAFTAKADKELTGTLALAQSGGKAEVISQQFTLTPTEQTYTFTTADALAEGGAYDIFWQFGSADNQKLGSADVEISGISMYVPTERLEVMRSVQKVTVNGKAVTPDIYNINGSNYFKLRDLAVLLNGTDGQFVVRYNAQSNVVNLTTDKEYTPVGGELATGPDMAATCVRSPQDVTVNGKAVNLKVYNIGGSNFFRLRDLNELLGFGVDYEAKTNTVLITSPLTPERQEATYAYDTYFRPEIDGESQPYVGDTMPFYDNGTYYIYYLKEGGDSYNHSVYLTTTKDFVHYTERPTPVLEASRADVQDSWIGTGSVVKADSTYYFFYTGFNSSGSQEYHEKIMVAKGSSPTSFTKVSGWSITPPAELNQKNDFRDPQAYYDPATKTISLTVTASKDGAARILKYTLGKDLSNVTYDGIIFTDPTGAFYNLECSDTFQLGNKWYLTYSGQEDTLWYATADSRFGPYSEPTRLDGKIFYAGKHVEDGKNAYMIGWARRSETASSTEEVSGWGGNLTVQKLSQQKDGGLSLVPVDSIASAFKQQKQLASDTVTLTAGSGKSYKQAFIGEESYLLSGEFTYSGSGSFGLAFDFSGKEEQYKLVSVDPAEGKLKLSFNNGVTPIAEMKAKLAANQKHTFTYIQDGSVGIFYLDGQAALTVRLYGTTGKPIYLFAENNSVTFTTLRQFTR